MVLASDVTTILFNLLRLLMAEAEFHFLLEHPLRRMLDLFPLTIIVDVYKIRTAIRSPYHCSTRGREEILSAMINESAIKRCIINCLY